MDNEHDSGLDCGEITGNLMGTLQGCHEHARSGHMLKWTSEPELEPEQRGNGGLTSAQQYCAAAPPLCLTSYQILLLSKIQGESIKTSYMCRCI